MLHLECQAESCAKERLLPHLPWRLLPEYTLQFLIPTSPAASPKNLSTEQEVKNFSRSLRSLACNPALPANMSCQSKYKVLSICSQLVCTNFKAMGCLNSPSFLSYRHCVAIIKAICAELPCKAWILLGFLTADARSICAIAFMYDAGGKRKS